MITHNPTEDQVNVTNTTTWVGGRSPTLRSLPRINDVGAVNHLIVDLILVIQIRIQNFVGRDEVKELAKLKPANRTRKAPANVVAHVADLVGTIATGALGHAAARISRLLRACNGTRCIADRHVVRTWVTGT